MTNVWEKISIGLAVAVFLVAVGARWTGLSQHFSHVDDVGVAKSIIAAQQEGRNVAVAVSEHWTYAPFQFLFTALFVNPDQNYRELLFWGRLPSAAFSVIGLALFLWCFYRRQGRISFEAVAGLAVLGLSWPGIILAQQMHNYALGVTASIAVLLLLTDRIRREQGRIWEIVGEGVLLGIVTSTQYSVVFLMPAYFAVRLLSGLNPASAAHRVWRNIFVLGLVYVVAIFPLWWFFLKKLIAAGYGGVTDWNRGPAGEFFFTLPDAGWGERVSYAFTFFTGNFYRVMEASTAFFPEDFFLRVPFAVLVIVLIVLGMIRMLRAPAPERWLGRYIAGVLLIWTALVVMGKLTLSPTRHSLILLPLFCVLISEGLAFLSGLRRKYQPIVPVVFIFFVMIVFLFQYPVYLEQRRDPFDEQEIIGLVRKYQVDAVIQAEWTAQVEVMKEVRDHYGYFGKHFLDYSLITRDPGHYDSILWVSHREPLTISTLQETYQKINRFVYLSNALRARAGEKPWPFWDLTTGSYRTVFKKEITSDIESEYSRQTRNGSNNLFLYVLQRNK